MLLTEICIKRPVFSTVLSLVLIVIGLVGFININTRYLPKFEQQSIHISTDYTGASAKLIESSITTPIEQAISGVSGIESIKSISTQGNSTITVTLDSGANSLQVSNQLRNKIAFASSQLPTNVKAPTVTAGWGDMELMDLGVTDPNESPAAIRDYLKRYVINNIQQIPGIANVDIDGANQYVMLIKLDPQKMQAFHLGVNDIITAIQTSNVQMPAGAIHGNTLSYPITAKTKLTSATQFANVILKKVNDNLVYLKDLATVELTTLKENRTIVKINGKPGVALSVYNTTDANPIAAADQVMQLIKQINQQLPPGMKIIVAYNQANFMKASIREVYWSILFSIICVAGVIFLFLGNLRTLLVPIITIPVCLISAFGLIYFFGFTINIITLLALVLSIGLVVDDAIVMLENIYRHVENGLDSLTAAIKGSQEITFAVIAMTLTLAAVYAPMALVKGRIAIILDPFALTLAGAVIISGFVALTLSPMMCARILSRNIQQKNHYAVWLEHFFKRCTEHYQKFLHDILKYRLWVVFLAILIAAGGVYLFKKTPFVFAPKEDMGILISVVHDQSGVSVDYSQHQINMIQQLIKEQPETKNTVSFATESNVAGPDNMIFVTLKPYADRKRSANTIAETINNLTKNIPGLNVATFTPSLGGSSHYSLAFYVMGPGNYQQLYHHISSLMNQLNTYPGLRAWHTDLKFNSQQYDLTVNRTLAGRLQVSVQAIDNAMASLLGSNNISNFDMAGQEYDVYVQADDQYRHDVNAINHFNVKSSTGKLVPLSELVTLKPVLAQNTLRHFNRLRAAMVSAQLNPGYNLGNAVQYLQKKLPQILPTGYHYVFIGQAKRLLQASQGSGTIFLLAIVFIYLVLSAQFESFIDPFIILLAVPLSLVGALFCLQLIGGSLNIYTIIGLVTLIGLIAKHGILITHFANELKAQGLATTAALIKAAGIRLRPILMTTMAMIFGVLPLIFASGASSASREQIGTVIGAGLLFGTFFSLILVPVVYSYADKLKNKLLG